jgi:hypothetical protein
LVLAACWHIMMMFSWLGEPYYRYNEREYRWIIQESAWTYSKTFDVVLDRPHVDLVFKGLDTAWCVLASSSLLFYLFFYFYFWFSFSFFIFYLSIFIFSIILYLFICFILFFYRRVF